MRPTKKYPPNISDEDQKRLTKEITDAVNTDVLPAYKKFADFARNEYAPQGRTTLAITSLADGQKRYENDIYGKTTTHMTADEIHQLGLREIDRIEAEMTALAKKAGFADLAAFRASLKDNPKYMPISSEQILDEFRRYIGQMETKAARTVYAAAQIAGDRGSDTGIPGQCDDALHDWHTGRQASGPGCGRGFQLCRAVAHRRRGCCLPRRRAGTSHAALGPAAASGFAKIPVTSTSDSTPTSKAGRSTPSNSGKRLVFTRIQSSDYGRLSSELFRAVRLVVDTGIHSKGWSRDQVVEFFRKSGAVDEPTIQTETDRYISWPAQALSYKLGQLKFRELRERAQKELGPKFDLRKFHDEMLDGGSLPLDMLDARTNNWIARTEGQVIVRAPRARAELTRISSACAIF